MVIQKVLIAFHAGFKKVSKEFQGCFKDNSWKIQGYLHSVSRKFQENVQGVL